MDRDLIKKKLKELGRYIRALENFQGLDLPANPDNLEKIWSVEHGLQLAVQIVIDVGNHILASMGENQIEDYTDVIDRLGATGILPVDFAKEIRDMAGFRNILVHEYIQVDLQVVSDVVDHRLGDFAEFIAYISEYLRTH